MNKIYYLPYSQNRLAHSGVRGMKWGVRRWQNKDGSLTPEGRIHYGYGEAQTKNSEDFRTNRARSWANSVSTASFSGFFNKRAQLKPKTPEEKAAAAEKKATKSEEKTKQKIEDLRRRIDVNKDEIAKNMRSAEEYAKKAEEHRAIAEGYKKRGDDYFELADDLEWTNAQYSKKIQKLERDLVKLRSRKVSKVEPKLSELNDQLAHVRDVKLEETETTLRDYFKSSNDYDAYQKWIDEHVG